MSRWISEAFWISVGAADEILAMKLGSLVNWVDESDQLVESTHSTAATASKKS